LLRKWRIRVFASLVAPVPARAVIVHIKEEVERYSDRGRGNEGWLFPHFFPSIQILDHPGNPTGLVNSRGPLN